MRPDVVATAEDHQQVRGLALRSELADREALGRVIRDAERWATIPAARVYFTERGPNIFSVGVQGAKSSISLWEETLRATPTGMAFQWRNGAYGPDQYIGPLQIEVVDVTLAPRLPLTPPPTDLRAVPDAEVERLLNAIREIFRRPPPA